MELLNRKELEEWLFDRANVQGHLCAGVKGVVPRCDGLPPQPVGFNKQSCLVNVEYVDTNTQERFFLEYRGCGDKMCAVCGGV